MKLLPALLLDSYAAGNETVSPYAEAKRLLYSTIYRGHRVTLYCGAFFDADRSITLPPGFIIAAHEDRAYRAETEHIVVAENFGRAFPKWREGAPQCGGRRGRKCGETNEKYRFMEADLHNLAPAIGAVNAARRNYRFGMLPMADADWGSCAMKIRGRTAEPPDAAKGIMPRTYLYMVSQTEVLIGTLLRRGGPPVRPESFLPVCLPERITDTESP